MDYSSLWDVRILLDLFLGGVGIGIFLFLAFGVWGKGEERLPILKAGSIASLVLVGLGALCLVSELGRPFGIMSTVTGFNATSITSWGGMLQMAFLLIDAALCVMLFALKDNVQGSVAFKIVGAVGVGLASLVLVYHGLVLNSVGRGLWADALITPLFMASSLLAGGAAAIAIDRFTGSILPAGTARFLAAASIAVAVLMLAFGFTVAPAGADAVYCYNIMMQQSGMVWWLCALGVGAIAPLALSVIALAKPSVWNTSLVVATAVCAVAGSFALKFVLTSTAQIFIG
ncbi:NrfD/PsrC family molybdoenzyme membrane anchor subunit [Gordonibacter massiliensis (ex Traore et al. 2017)]|uniref:Polysulfide reductase NrfD n=1 Tax=Gordonibacter massiliensis (ex Traore et al. 2017) TaxID=1841863 RepID=A0A842J8T4_9ACTN|nr:NrfD/PsrC family molybdoenzyme membrane anchor subunit [Gordonibacter massiliensis (ex Traore et al. 2017)]MBC2888147.1 polysulfide reductase NrfD [Gordonibacter massiliensis (ex Traore et al. 2017)]